MLLKSSGGKISQIKLNLPGKPEEIPDNSNYIKKWRKIIIVIVELPIYLLWAQCWISNKKINNSRCNCRMWKSARHHSTKEWSKLPSCVKMRYKRKKSYIWCRLGFYINRSTTLRWDSTKKRSTGKSQRHKIGENLTEKLETAISI